MHNYTHKTNYFNPMTTILKLLGTNIILVLLLIVPEQSSSIELSSYQRDNELKRPVLMVDNGEELTKNAIALQFALADIKPYQRVFRF